VDFLPPPACQLCHLLPSACRFPRQRAGRSDSRTSCAKTALAVGHQPCPMPSIWHRAQWLQQPCSIQIADTLLCSAMEARSDRDRLCQSTRITSRFPDDIHSLTSVTASKASFSRFATSNHSGLKNFCDRRVTGDGSECSVPIVSRWKRCGFAWYHCKCVAVYSTSIEFAMDWLTTSPALQSTQLSHSETPSQCSISSQNWV
jgi:hypothetical protein